MPAPSDPPAKAWTGFEILNATWHPEREVPEAWITVKVYNNNTNGEPEDVNLKMEHHDAEPGGVCYTDGKPWGPSLGAGTNRTVEVSCNRHADALVWNGNRRAVTY